MENPGSSYEKLVYNKIDYRSCVICFLPTLEYLDDAVVTKDEKINALLNVDAYHLMNDVLDTASERNLKIHEEHDNLNELREDLDDEEYITFESNSYPG